MDNENVSILVGFVQQVESRTTRVIAFVEPSADDVRRLPATFRGIEIFTGRFAHATSPLRELELSKIKEACDAALDRGFIVNAGHDLRIDDLKHLLSIVPEIAEVSIGHELLVEAMRRSFRDTVSDFVAIARCSQNL